MEQKKTAEQLGIKSLCEVCKNKDRCGSAIDVLTCVKFEEDKK